MCGEAVKSQRQVSLKPKVLVEKFWVATDLASYFPWNHMLTSFIFDVFQIPNS